MPIDLASVNWVYVGVLAVFVFVASLVGSLLSFRHHVLGSLLSAVLFAAAFVFWSYYPHHLPLPTRLSQTVRLPAVTSPPAPVSPPKDVGPAKSGQ